MWDILLVCWDQLSWLSVLPVTGQAWETEKTLLLFKNCSATTEALLCCQYCLHYKSKTATYVLWWIKLTVSDQTSTQVKILTDVLKEEEVNQTSRLGSVLHDVLVDSSQKANSKPIDILIREYDTFIYQYLFVLFQCLYLLLCYIYDLYFIYYVCI